ncbi:AzlC family ABC transporter permease [Nocardia caishijiensis]|nr:AzlC family ABC transporter permease [Nocardia caishijiensis]
MRSIWRTLDRRTSAAVAAACLAVGLFGVSYGASTIAAGFPVWMPIVAAVTVLAGGSELLFFGIVAAGGSPLAAVVAGLLLNARHLPYGLAAPDVFGHGWRRLLGIHVLNDESVAFATAPGARERKRAAYWACGIGVALCWPLGATLGAALGSLVPDTSALGLDAVFPVILLALLLPALRDRATLRPVLAGAGLAVAIAPFVPAGLPVLIALIGLVLASRPVKPSDSAAAQPESVGGVGHAEVDAAGATPQRVPEAGYAEADAPDATALAAPQALRSARHANVGARGVVSAVDDGCVAGIGAAGACVLPGGWVAADSDCCPAAAFSRGGAS